MMRLRDTVSYFSTEVFTDAFNSAVTFKARMNPFAEITNSGESSRRRILDTSTSVVIPAGRVIIAPSGEKFIVAAANYDFWKGEAIRHKYSVLPVEVMGGVGSIGEVLAGAPADSTTYCYPYFVRREIDALERSDYLSGHELYFSQVKSFARSSIVVLGAVYYRLQTDTWIDGAGFAMAQAVKLESPVQVFDLTISRATGYNPVTDTIVGTAANSVTCFMEDLRVDYEFVSPSFTEIAPGDKAISILKSAVTVGINTLIDDYIVLGIRDMGTWVTCQCRRLS